MPVTIAENFATVRERIAVAAQRSGRRAADVQLVAVTKYADLEAIRQLIAAGCLDLGESRPQQLWQRSDQLPVPGLRWHLVGHLQRNKIRRTLPIVALVHSLDSPRLLTALEEEARLAGRNVAALLEINVSGDATKHGLAAEEAEPLLATLPDYPHVAVQGLMTMAPREGDLDDARRSFARLRELRDSLQAVAPPGVELRELSMGMSGDFEAAIEEGATIVRVGSALFEGLPSA
jgi:pyridoxal phosphate enzyme (YggS family)